MRQTAMLGSHLLLAVAKLSRTHVDCRINFSIHATPETIKMNEFACDIEVELSFLLDRGLMK
jgi:hypothetical protein